MAAVLGIVAVGAVAVALRVTRAAPTAIDLGWDRLMHSAASSTFTAFASVLAVLGAGLPDTVIVAIIALLVGVIRGWFWAGFVAVAAIISAIDVSVLKSVAARGRPDAAFGVANAFPSGHTTAAAVLAGVVILLFRRRIVRVLAVLWVLAMAWSRTALHAHWFTDVLAGIVLGMATAVVLLALASRMVRPWTRSSS